MKYFIDENFTYFEGDIEYERRQGRICTEVPRKPSLFHEWIDEKWQLTEVGLVRKEEERIGEVKIKFSAELFDLVYANKDNPTALAAAMCDRVKEIDEEIKIEETTKEKTS